MRGTLLADTGLFTALFDKRDAHHARALGFVREFKGVFLSNLAVLTETVFLLDFHREAQLSFLRWVAAGAVSIPPVESADLARAAELMENYRNVPMDLADALLVVAAEKENIQRIATLDSDFEIYRLPNRKTFHIVFREFA